MLKRQGSKVLLAALALAAMLGTGPRQAGAQTTKIGNFDSATITGITATLLSGTGAPATTKDWKFSLDSLANSTFTFTDGINPSGPFHILQILGVYQVGAPGGGLGNEVGNGPSGWMASDVSGGDGFTALGNSYRIDNGESREGYGSNRFRWTNKTGTIWWGFHVKWYTNASCNTTDTGYIYGTIGGLNPNGSPAVPEPAFYQMAALMGLGGLGIFRLRRSRK